MTIKNIMRIVPIIQSASLVGDNLKFVNKKKKKSEDFVKMGVKNVVGVSLIQFESQLIEDL
jgi:hypothetical protein